MVELTLSHVPPFVFGRVKESLHLSLTCFVAILKKFSKLGFNFSVGFDDNLDVEVVHDIRVVSLKWDTIWSNDYRHDTVNFLSLVIVLIYVCNLHNFFFLILVSLLALFLFLLNVRSNYTHSKFSHDNIPVVIHLNIHLDCMDHVQLASAFFVITTFIRNRALSSQNLGHVVVLYVSQSFFRVLGSSAEKLVQVIDNAENPGVHLHKFK